MFFRAKTQAKKFLLNFLPCAEPLEHVARDEAEDEYGEVEDGPDEC